MKTMSLGVLRKNGASPRRTRCAAEFGLEDDDHADGDEGEEAVVEDGDALKGEGLTEDAGGDGEDDHDDEDALEGAGGASSLNEADDHVDDAPDEQELDRQDDGRVGGEAFEQALDAVD